MFDDLSIGMMLITVVILIFLLSVLKNMLFTPLVRFMDDREANIKRDENKILVEASNLDSNDSAVSKIYQEAILKANSIKAEQLQISKNNADKLIEEHKIKLDNEFNIFKSELILKKSKFKEELVEALSNSNIESCLNRIKGL